MPTTPNLDEVSKILKRYLPVGYQAVLFGSRATGQARLRSDWDIGLLGPAPLRGAILEYIREELEEMRTLHSFDVVDLNNVPDFFRKAALKKVVRLI
jgi:predicted nucleotidyltransferase